MGYVHCQPSPVFLHVQVSFFPINWCWINQLAGFTGSDNRFDKFFLDTIGLTILAKYNVLLMLWVATLLVDVSHLTFIYLTCCSGATSCISSPPFLCRSSYLCNTLVRPSVQFRQDFTNVTSIISAYSSTKACSVPNRHLTNILAVAFAFTHAFPVKVSDTQRCTYAESVIICNTCACHWRTRLTPLINASSLARLMCLAWFTCRQFKEFVNSWGVHLRFQCTHVPARNSIMEHSYRSIKTIAARKNCPALEVVIWSNMTPKDNLSFSTLPADWREIPKGKCFLD